MRYMTAMLFAASLVAAPLAWSQEGAGPSGSGIATGSASAGASSDAAASGRLPPLNDAITSGNRPAWAGMITGGSGYVEGFGYANGTSGSAGRDYPSDRVRRTRR